MTWYDIGGGDKVWIETDEDRKEKVTEEVETGEDLENNIENEIEDESDTENTQS